MSRRVVVLVEGPTELNFIKQFLSPIMSLKGVHLHPQYTGKPGSHRRSLRYARIRQDILAVLKQNTDNYCTTMFDYYGLSADWPGRTEAASHSQSEKSRLIEDGVSRDIATELGDSLNLSRLIPYVQMHEFEAILYSDISILADSTGIAFTQLDEIVQQFSSPEEINDNPQSAPSKRIIRLCNNYSKTIMGITVAQKTGIDTIRQKCSHFNDWINNLERLASHGD